MPYERRESTSPQLFISYSRRDILGKILLQEELQKTYPDIWSDSRFVGSEVWWNEILQRIDDCDIFVYLLSPESMYSPYCRAEFSEAVRLQKPILPLQIAEISRVLSPIDQYQIIKLLAETECSGVISRVATGINSAYQKLNRSQRAPLWTTQTQLPTDVKTITVSASIDPQGSENLLNTGIFLAPDDKVTISATSYVSIDDGKNWFRPDGIVTNDMQQPILYPHNQAYKTKNIPANTATRIGYVGSLIGWIGHGGYAIESRAFYIGNEYKFTVDKGESGFLYLAVNDAAGTYEDNKGEFKVRVLVEFE